MGTVNMLGCSLGFKKLHYIKTIHSGSISDSSGLVSCYIKLDIIHRILKEYYDIHPVVAIGVTDVSEEILKKSKLLKKPVWEITKKYSSDFFDHMNALNVLQPKFKLKVSDHIGSIQHFVEELIKKRAAYRGIDGTVYFATEADEHYGRFRESPETITPDQDAFGKRNARDFALWKPQSEQNAYGSPWGRGLPGWHIECSVMASSIFGSTIDLHSGGSDLIFPHHENEEAQSTCYHNCDQWVNYWLHSGLINVGDVKMSKSLGNFITIEDFLSHHRSDHLRMLCFMSSYRTDLCYDDTTIQLAINTWEKVNSFLDLAESYIVGKWIVGNVQEAELLENLENTKNIVKKHLANDFGTPEALKAVMLLIKSCSKMLNEKPTGTSSRSPAVVALVTNYVGDFFHSFGFTLEDVASKRRRNSAVDTVITAAVNIRSRVRKIGFQTNKTQNRQNIFHLCDIFRSKLEDSGVQIQDIGPNQSNWSFKSAAMENKTLLKDVIDYVVWFRKELEMLKSDISGSRDLTALMELSRYIQMYFATLGVTILDHPNGHSDWQFPNLDQNRNSLTLESVIRTTLKFREQVKEVAEKVSSKEEKDDIICLCEAIISDLNEVGVNVDEKSIYFDIEDERGMSILHQVIDIAVHFREQILVIACLTNDSSLNSQLFKLIGLTRKNLSSYGLYIMETPSHVATSWKMKRSAVNKMVFINIIDIIADTLCQLMRHSKFTNDSVAERIILDLSDSVVDDLSELGIVISYGHSDISWKFEPSKGEDNFLMCGTV